MVKSTYLSTTLPSLERLYSGVNIEGPLLVPSIGNCHVWTDRCNSYGYGYIYFDGKTILTHRLSWLLQIGIIPVETPCVLHHCDNPPCIRLDHLWLGTRAQNNADKTAKGRQVRGELHPSTRFTDTQIAEIRTSYLSGGKQKAIAERFGCTQQHVSLLVRGFRRK